MTGFIQGNNSTGTHVWEHIPSYVIPSFLLLSLLIVLIFSFLKLNDKIAYPLLLSYYFLCFSILPVVFHPVVGYAGDGTWFIAAYARTIQLSLPIAHEIFQYESLFDIKRIYIILFEIVPVLLLIHLNKIFGISYILVISWINPVIASLSIPASLLLIIKSYLKRRQLIYLLALTYLLLPSLVFMVATFTAFGMSMILAVSYLSVMILSLNYKTKELYVLLIGLTLGILFTHPFTGLVTLIMTIGTLYYIYISNLQRKVLLLLISFSLIFIPYILIYSYFGIIPKLTFKEENARLLVLDLFGSSSDFHNIFIRSTCWFFTIYGILQLWVYKDKDEQLYPLYLGIILILGYIFGRMFLTPMCPLNPARYLLLSKIFLLPATIYGVFSFSRMFVKTNLVITLKFNKYSLRFRISELLKVFIALLISIMLLFSFIMAYPVDFNKLGQPIPLEFEASKKLGELTNKTYGVITDYTNNQVGAALYGIHNPKAYYLHPLDTRAHRFFPGLPRTIQDFLNDYKLTMRKYGINSQLEKVYVIISSYRFQRFEDYKRFVSKLSTIGEEIICLKDQELNEIKIFEIKNYTRTIQG